MEARQVPNVRPLRRLDRGGGATQSANSSCAGGPAHDGQGEPAMSEQTSGSNDGGNDFKKEVDALVEGATGLFSNLREIFEKSRDEITRASRLGKTRLDLLQLEKDREHFLQRLGEITLGLMKDGTVVHDSLTEIAEKIEALDARKVEYEEEVARVAEEQAEAQANKAATAESANEADGETNAQAAAEVEVEAAVEAANAAVEPSAKKTSAKEPPAKKTTAKEPPAKKTTARKNTARKTTAKKTPAKKTTARKTPAKKPKKDL